jgi:hypothetical protein
LYNNVTVALLTTVKVSRGVSSDIFSDTTLEHAISNIGDKEIINTWTSTGLFDAVVNGSTMSDESWSLSGEGITGYFVITTSTNTTTAYQTINYNISIAQLNLSSIIPGSTLNVFSNNIPDFTLMDDFTYTSQSTNITLTSMCGLTCMQFSSITIPGLMSLNSSLQNVIRAIIEGTGISITSYSYVDGFLIPPSWIAINVVLVIFTILLVILMIIGTPIHYKSTLRQVIINSVPDDEDSPKLTRAATELSLMKIDDLNYVGVAIDGKPIRTRKNIDESLLTDTK